MPILTAPQRAALAARLALPDLSGLTDASAAAALNAPTLGAAPQVPRFVRESELMGLLSPASLANVLNHLRFSDLKRDIEAQYHGSLLLWATVFHAIGLIEQAERDAIHAYLSATVDGPRPFGPSWVQATFPGLDLALPDGRRFVGVLPVEAITEARS